MSRLANLLTSQNRIKREKRRAWREVWGPCALVLFGLTLLSIGLAWLLIQGQASWLYWVAVFQTMGIFVAWLVAETHDRIGLTQHNQALQALDEQLADERARIQNDALASEASTGLSIAQGEDGRGGLSTH